MLGLLESVWGFVSGLLELGWELINLVLSFAWGVLHHLHVEAPRLEGLLIGVALAWLLMRRDRHPVLRVLSSPLKLVVDILDLAWDQVIEIVVDIWGVVTGWIRGTLGWCRERVVGVWNRGLSLLTGLRDRLRRDE